MGVIPIELPPLFVADLGIMSGHTDAYPGVAVAHDAVPHGAAGELAVDDVIRMDGPDAGIEFVAEL